MNIIFIDNNLLSNTKKMTNYQETSAKIDVHIVRFLFGFMIKNQETGNQFSAAGFGKDFSIRRKSKTEKDDLNLIVSLELGNNNWDTINRVGTEGSINFTVKFQFIGKDGVREYAGPNACVNNVNSLMELCQERL